MCWSTSGWRRCRCPRAGTGPSSRPWAGAWGWPSTGPWSGWPCRATAGTGAWWSASGRRCSHARAAPAERRHGTTIALHARPRIQRPIPAGRTGPHRGTDHAAAPRHRNDLGLRPDCRRIQPEQPWPLGREPHLFAVDRPDQLAHHRTGRSEEHTSELQSQSNLVCRLLLEKKKYMLQVLYREHASLLWAYTHLVLSQPMFPDERKCSPTG